MSAGKSRQRKLRVGDLVEVRAEQEILATLDDQGAIDGLPFMPEMFEYCGKRFRVDKRADKTCNTITIMESRRLFDTVHLQDLRCSGTTHGGCQAQCLLFWKESWLRLVEKSESRSVPSSASATAPHSPLSCNRDRLYELTRQPQATADSEIAYRCQATDLLKASTSLPWWDIRQYVRDVWSRNVRPTEALRTLLFRVFLKSLKVGVAYRAQIWIYNRVQAWRRATPYPYREGRLDKTPRETLDLRPGELVQVKSYDEILATLNTKNKNFGLRFDAEMVPYCGGVRRVRARVERIIDERTGKMLIFPRECIILDGVICRAEYSENRLFCPRAIYPYWREIWLRRVADNLQPGSEVSASMETAQTPK